MRKVLAISITTLLLLCLATMAFAAENNWRFNVKAATPEGFNYSTQSQIGIHSTALDGLDAMDQVYDYIDGTGTVAFSVAQMGTDTYQKDIKQYVTDANKVWTIRVAATKKDAENMFPSQTIRLNFITVSSTTLPPAAVASQAATYKLTMVNNKDYPGAPANGTVWTLPLPTVHSTSAWWYLDLPALNLNAIGNNSLMTSLAYELTVEQLVVIPEPTSFLALGTGLLGLAGFVIRRRRS